MVELILSAGKVTLTVLWFLGLPILLVLLAYMVFLVVRIAGGIFRSADTSHGLPVPRATLALRHLVALGFYLVLVALGLLYKAWVVAKKAGDAFDLGTAFHSAHVLWLPFVPFFLGWLGCAYGLATFGMVAAALFRTTDAETVRLSYALTLIYLLASYFYEPFGLINLVHPARGDETCGGYSRVSTRAFTAYGKAGAIPCEPARCDP